MRKKLNIAIICDAIDYTAGSFVSIKRWTDILNNRGHKVIFLSAKSPTNRVNNLYNTMKIYRFKSFLLPKTEKEFYIVIPSRKRLREILIKEEIDIIHIIIPTPIAIVVARLAKDIGIKVVMHSHTQPENIFLHMPNFFFVKKINSLFYRYLVWLYKKTDIIIYPSEFSKKIFEEKFNTHLNNKVISNGVDINKFKKSNVPEEFTRRYDINKNNINLLYVGRLHPEKNIPTLIKSMSYVLKHKQNIRLYIAGDGHLDSKLKKLVVSIGLGKHIIFLGRVSDSDLIHAYNICNIFILPSLAELEGMVVLEAMACGKPLLIADSEESASVYLIKDNGFLFNPYSPIELAQKIITLANDKELLAKMSSNSLRLSREYDIEESVTNIENIYYDLLR